MTNRLALAFLLLLLAGPAWGAEASLAAAPFQVTVIPSTLEQGNAAMIRLDQLDQEITDALERSFDIYVIRITISPFVKQYLTPSGWSSMPRAYRHGVSLSAFQPIETAWQETHRPGWTFLVVMFVQQSGNSFNRSLWVFRPIIYTVKVRSTLAGVWPRAAHTVGPLGFLTLVASTLVLLYRGGAVLSLKARER